MAIRQTDGLGTLVKRYRTSLGLTQEELAERAGVSARSISDLERGLNRAPHLSTIRRLADALELAPDQRAAFMVAGSQSRGGDDGPVLKEARSRRPAIPRPARRLIAAFGLLCLLILLGMATVIVVMRGSASSAARTAVYSTARAPAILGRWGSPSGSVPYIGPDISIIATGPPGYEYAMGPGTDAGITPTAVRFSPNGRTLSVFPVADQSAGFADAEVDMHGNLWVTTGTDIQEFSSDGHLLAQWSRTGFNPGQFDGPLGISFAHNGDVIVGEYYSHRVQVLTPAMKPVRHWSGPGNNAQTFSPQIIALDAQDNLYILDTGNWQIDKYTLQGKLLGIWRPHVLRKIPKGATGRFDLAVAPNRDVYVTESIGTSLSIEKLSPSGQALRTWTSLGPNVPAPSTIDALRFTPEGYGFVGFTDGRVVKVDQNLHVLASWTVQQLRQPLFRSPVAVTAASNGHVYVADAAAHQVIGISTRTGDVTDWAAPITRASAGAFTPSIAVDPEGNLVVSGAKGTSLHTYSPGGKLLRRSPSPSSGPGTLAYTALGIDGHGNLTVLTYPQPNVETFSPSGRLLHHWCAVCDIQGTNTPISMRVDPTGNVYVAAPSQIVELTPEGVPLRSWSGETIAGRGTIFDATGFAVDRHGDVYVSDLDNYALEIFSPSGRKLASWTRLGPNGQTLNDLGALTVDDQGNIFVLNGKSLLELAPLRDR